MTDNANRKNNRGPLISSREVLTKAELEADTAMPWQMFADATARVTHDLMKRVGYGYKITVTIEALNKEHPQSPGYMVAAKMRRP